MKSIREYKAPSIWTPILIIGEVAMECMLPFIIAQLINEIQAGCEFSVIAKYGGILADMALSLYVGVRLCHVLYYGGKNGVDICGIASSYGLLLGSYYKKGNASI